MNTSADSAVWDWQENIDGRLALCMAVFSFLFFSLVNVVLTRQGPSKAVTTDFWRWRNTYVSWIHAMIVGPVDLYCITVTAWMFTDLMGRFNYVMYLLIAFSEGYFIYDALDIVISMKVGKCWEVLIHHSIVIWTFWYNLQMKMAIPYTIVGLMAEINSIFLHARKLLQFNQWSFQHWLYRLVIVMNFFTFVTFRFTAILLVGYGLVVHRHNVPTSYHVAVSVSMVAICIINPVLFWRLLKNDVLRKFNSFPPKKTVPVVMNGKNNNSHVKNS